MEFDIAKDKRFSKQMTLLKILESEPLAPATQQKVRLKVKP